MTGWVWLCSSCSMGTTRSAVLPCMWTLALNKTAPQGENFTPKGSGHCCALGDVQDEFTATLWAVGCENHPKCYTRALRFAFPSESPFWPKGFLAFPFGSQNILLIIGWLKKMTHCSPELWCHHTNYCLKFTFKDTSVQFLRWINEKLSKSWGNQL